MWLRLYIQQTKCLAIHCQHVHRMVTVRGRNTSSWSASRVRKAFLDYFSQKKDHLYVHSSSVLLGKKTGSYFTNAGMNQFKPIFLGNVEPDSEMATYYRVTNSQKCIRVGGKHNDLDDVGKDFHHHTFFEMLGNWSFGDYFKKEACTMALQMLTEEFKIDKNRLYFTYFAGDDNMGLGPDLECKEIWLQLNIPANRILPFGVEENFWGMLETGPCGPCTEIHYDHLGKGDSAKLVNSGSPYMVEIWNLVFMQFDRQPDRSLKDLLRCHVDTGMGLERISAVMCSSLSNYDTDLFIPLFNRIHQETGIRPYQGLIGKNGTEEKIDTAYRIVADHARMYTVAIADGLIPGKGNLAHKLRQIIHRCANQAHSVLHAPQGLLARLVDDVVDSLGEAFPEITKNPEKIKNIVTETEEHYLKMLKMSQKMMEKAFRKIGDDKTLPVKQIWALHEGHYGFQVPIDNILNLAEERGLFVDLAGLDRKIQESKEQNKLAEERSSVLSHPAETLKPATVQHLSDNGVLLTDDSYKYSYSKINGGYDFGPPLRGKILQLLHHGRFVNCFGAGESGAILLDKTCMYSESGGQAADQGEIKGKYGSFKVEDVQSFQGYVLHIGHVKEGSLKFDDNVEISLNEHHRQGCMRNHTTTHLLHYALCRALGDVAQQGSKVESNKFTFDFSYIGNLPAAKLQEIEGHVKQLIKDGQPVFRELLPLTSALKIRGLQKTEIKKHRKNSFVVSIGKPAGVLLDSPEDDDLEVSAELCGGTHVQDTRDIEAFVIVKLSSISHGCKRATCVTGAIAKQALQNAQQLMELAESYKKSISQCNQDVPELELMMKIMHKKLSDEMLPKLSRETMKTELDQLQDKLRKLRKSVDRSQLIKELQSIVEMEKRNYVVACLQFDRTLEVSKILTKVTLDKPAVLISKKSKGLIAVINIPQESENQLTLSHMGEYLCEVTNGKGQYKKYGNIPLYIITVKDSSKLEQLQKEAVKYLEQQTDFFPS